MKWRRDGQLLALLVVLGAVAGGSWLWRASHSASPQPVDLRLDLNAATVDELAALPGIGASSAEAILRYRAARGRFTSVDELAQVPGLDVRTVEKVRPLVRVR